MHVRYISITVPC